MSVSSTTYPFDWSESTLMDLDKFPLFNITDHETSFDASSFSSFSLESAGSAHRTGKKLCPRVTRNNNKAKKELLQYQQYNPAMGPGDIQMFIANMLTKTVHCLNKEMPLIKFMVCYKANKACRFLQEHGESVQDSTRHTILTWLTSFYKNPKLMEDIETNMNDIDNRIARKRRSITRHLSMAAMKNESLVYKRPSNGCIHPARSTQAGSRKRDETGRFKIEKEDIVK